MNIKQEREIIIQEEINLYHYWKVLVKRKKILIGIFLVPFVIVTIASLSLPRYYRGESEISISKLPASNIPSIVTAQNIVRLIGNIDDSQKVKIFTNPGVIESVSISLPKKSIDKINIIVDAKTADIIPQAFKDIIDYINNLQEIKEEITRIQAETDLIIERAMEEDDFRIKNLTEVKKENLIFLNYISDMIKKRKLSLINFNPADLLRKDGELSIEIIHLQQQKKDRVKKKEFNVKVTAGILPIPSIDKRPTNTQLKLRIIIAGFLSLFTGIFVVFFLEYLDRMKAPEK